MGHLPNGGIGPDSNESHPGPNPAGLIGYHDQCAGGAGAGANQEQIIRGDTGRCCFPHDMHLKSQVHQPHGKTFEDQARPACSGDKNSFGF
jgi:hypothetical protein